MLLGHVVLSPRRIPSTPSVILAQAAVRRFGIQNLQPYTDVKRAGFITAFAEPWLLRLTRISTKSPVILAHAGIQNLQPYTDMKRAGIHYRVR